MLSAGNAREIASSPDVLTNLYWMVVLDCLHLAIHGAGLVLRMISTSTTHMATGLGSTMGGKMPNMPSAERPFQAYLAPAIPRPAN